MSDVEIKFEREDAAGIVAVGTYLIDAAKRFGILIEDKCNVEEHAHFCVMEISVGADLLSPRTSVEQEFFAENSGSERERLGCQAKFDKPGEAVIMTKKPKPVTDEEKKKKDEEEYRKEFAELPLEKKIAELVQLEAIAFSDTISFVINSPFKIADKVMDVMAEFGFKMEKDEKESVRPEEHRTNGSDKESAESNSKRKRSDKKEQEDEEAIEAE